MSQDHQTSNLRAIQTALINIAAQMVRGEGVPDWSDHKFYRTTSNGERREIMAALRDADEALRCYGVRLKEIADKVSSEIEWAKLSGDSSAPETSAPQALKVGDPVTYSPQYPCNLPREGWKVEVLPKLTYVITHPNGSVIAVDAGEIGTGKVDGLMKLWKVCVRRWHPTGKGLKLGVWHDVRLLIEAPNSTQAVSEGFESAMATKFFGVDPTHCEVMEAATVTLPYYL